MAQFFKAKKATSRTKTKKFSSVVIDKNDHHGKGIVLTTSPITIVEGVLRDETATIETYLHSKKVQKAKLVKVEKPSRDRITPFCEYYGVCGGCSMQHTGPLNSLYIKFTALNDYLVRQLNLANLPWQAPVLSNIQYEEQKFDGNIGKLLEESYLNNLTTCSQDAEITGYRRRIRLSVDARKKHDVKVGFRKKHTNEVVDISHCSIATKRINQLIKAIRIKLEKTNYSQLIGHIVITEGSLKTQVAFYLHKLPSYKSVNSLLDVIESTEQNCVVLYNSEVFGSSELINGSLSKNYNKHVFKDTDNSEFNEQTPHLQIEAITLNDIGALTTQIKSHHFLQVNKAVNSKMLQLAKDWLNPTKSQTLYDFYCGSGNFSLFLASLVNCVYGFEGVPEMVSQARENAACLAVTNCEFDCVDLSSERLDSLPKLENDAIVILDPAREGALQLCHFLSGCSAEKILYVSCNANSFSRDASHLLSTYSIEKIVCLDMFPFTEHVELMALFERRVN